MGCLGAAIIMVLSLVIQTLLVWGGINLIIWLLGLIGIALGFYIGLKVAFVIALILMILKAIF